MSGSTNPADLEMVIDQGLGPATWDERLKFIDDALSAGWDEETEVEAPGALVDGARQFVATVLRNLKAPPVESFEAAMLYRLSADPVHVLMANRWLVDNASDASPYEEFLLAHPGLARLYALDYRLKGLVAGAGG